MTIAVFGATGRTGTRVIDTAIAHDHHIRALVRDPGRIHVQSPGINTVVGDMTRRADVAATVAGVDAVIMAAGPVAGSEPGFVARAAEILVNEMIAAGTNRLIWLSGAAVIDSRDQPALSRSIVRGIMRLVAGAVLAAAQQGYETVIRSSLAYTVVRPPMLSDSPRAGALSAGYRPPSPRPVSRDDLAAFLIDLLERDLFIRESPFVSNRGGAT